MARKDVDLVIRARDEAAKVVDSITAAINEFVEAQGDLNQAAGKTSSTLGRLGTAPSAHHPAPSQAEFRGSVVDLWIAASGVTGHEPRVTGGRGEQVARAEVPGPYPPIPGHPLGG